MSKKQFTYTHESACRVGLMVCSACNKPITSGQYRYRDAGERYVSQHRACTELDTNWAIWDSQKLEHVASHEQFVAACVEFRKKWSDFLDGELDFYIPDAEE